MMNHSTMTLRAAIVAIVSLLALPTAVHGQCEEWEYLDPATPISSMIALIEFNGELYAGGGISLTGVVARWTGTGWTTIATADDVINSLAVYNGQLYAGGFFNSINGVAANGIARWDGVTWHPLGTGVSSVRGMAVYNGELIVGGSFSSAGGVPASRVARWNGSTWQSLGAGVSGSVVSTLTIFGGQLIAGGNFSMAGGIAANNIARWNGTSWQPLGPGLTGSSGDNVRSLTVHDGFLVAGGTFEFAGGAAANNIARWNGTSWQALGSGITGGAQWTSIMASDVYNGDLIVGGNFTAAGGSTAYSVARWNTISGWSALGDGFPFGLGTQPAIWSMKAHGNYIYVGGQHALHEGARWRDCGYGSCAGICGQQSSQGCWCDADCFNFGDCCDDVCYHCTHPPCTCQDNCGAQAPGGCWCDNSCFNFGDCCADICLHCSELNGCFGACCVPGLPCELLPEVECVAGGGMFRGIGSTCAADGCPPPDSCIGSCGGSAPAGCWCDNSCIGFGDCCEDACAACGVDGCDTSCNGSCGSSAPAGCWCDSSCFGYGDCCEDVCTWCEASTCSCHSDLNNDGLVDVSDMLILLGGWGPCSGFCAADLNGDTTVDVSDLLLILATWGLCPSELASQWEPASPDRRPSAHRSAHPQ